MYASHAAMTRCQLYPLVAASTRSSSFWTRLTHPPERAVVDGQEELRLGEAGAGGERRRVLEEAPKSGPRVLAGRLLEEAQVGEGAQRGHDVLVARPAVGERHLDGHGRAVPGVGCPIPRAVDGVAEDAGDVAPVVGVVARVVRSCSLHCRRG